jgi:hypothetical protein
MCLLEPRTLPRRFSSKCKVTLCCDGRDHQRRRWQASCMPTLAAGLAFIGVHDVRTAAVPANSQLVFLKVAGSDMGREQAHSNWISSRSWPRLAP